MSYRCTNSQPKKHNRSGISQYNVMIHHSNIEVFRKMTPNVHCLKYNLGEG